MEVFQGNYKIYQSVMCLSGLWPYDNSILTWIHRIAYTLLLLGCMVVQVVTIKNVKMSLNETVGMISFGAQLLLYFIRYSTTIMTFSTTKYVLDNMQNDFTMLKDPIEVEMLLKDSILAKRILTLYVGLTFTGSLCIIGTLGVSTFLESDIQIRFLYLLGYFYDEKSLRTNLTCLYIIISTMHGLITMVCSEGTITVLGSHLSGLLQVTSYRLRNAIDKVATSTTVRRIDIQPAVDLHRKAIEYSKKYADDMFMTSVVMILVVVSSFGVNIYRLYISITETKEIDEVILSLQFVFAYMAFIFGNNYSGQIVIDNSIKIIEEIYRRFKLRLKRGNPTNRIVSSRVAAFQADFSSLTIKDSGFHGIITNNEYNSLWYRIPTKMQKVVLFMFMKCQSLVAFNLAGLFILCSEGLAMMFSSSFSYFTLLCSVQ